MRTTITSPEPAPLGRWPLLLPAIYAILAIPAVELNWWLLIIISGLGSLASGILWKKPSLIGGSLALFIMATLHQQRLDSRDACAAKLEASPIVHLSGTLIESHSSGLVKRLFRTESGALISLIKLPESFSTGQKIALTALPLQTSPRRNPGGWNFTQILQRKGIVGTVAVQSAEVCGQSWGWARLRGWSESVRHSLAAQITLGITNEARADLIKAVVLGEKSPNNESFENFRKIGTMHVFAVSGLHIGLVALFVAAIGRLLRLPPRVFIWTIICAILVYAFITGLRPPALRASLMGTLLLSRFLLLRRSSIVNNLLAAALVILAVDSFQLWQVGFQLSFFVVAIILILEPLLWKKIEPVLSEDSYLPPALWTRWQKFRTSMTRQTGQMFTVSLTAWIGSAPLTLVYFGWFTPIASLASVVMVCFAFMILSIALISLAIGFICTPVQKALNASNARIAQVAYASATQMSQWPGAWMRTHTPAPWEGGLCVFDMPYGGSAIHLAEAGGVLIDTGSSLSFRRELLPAFHHYSLSCDSLIATHNDAQHVKGMEPALDYFPIKQILLPRIEERYSLGELITKAQKRTIPLLTAQVGQRFPLNSLSSLRSSPSALAHEEPRKLEIEVLSTGNSQASRANHRGLILRLHWNDWRILITSDAEYVTERWLLDRGVDFAADVWICERNERDLTGHDEFIKAMNPQLIITTQSPCLDSEPILHSWRKRLQDVNITVMSQKKHGAIFLLPKMNKLVAKGFISQEIITITH